MNYQELIEINSGKPSIELIDKFVREEQAIIFFYKQQFKKDKRNYWKGKILYSTMIIRRLFKKGVDLYGNSFIPENIGLKPNEIEELKKEYNLT